MPFNEYPPHLTYHVLPIILQIKKQIRALILHKLILRKKVSQDHNDSKD